MRHRIFIGSSSEDLTLANAIQRNLVQSGHSAKVWNQGIFSAGKTAFDSLLQALNSFDAAVFVFAPRDLVTMRGHQFEAVRDNVVFELGLFTGKLGRERTFWVVPRGQTQLRIASDLLGVLPAEYVEPADGDWVAALALPCQEIHKNLVEAARSNGRAHPALPAGVIERSMPSISNVLHLIASTITSKAVAVDDDCVEDLPGSVGFRARMTRNAVLTVSYGGIEDYGGEDPGSVVALPANEFFDEACVTDARSALGAYVQKHFQNRAEEFMRRVAQCTQRHAPVLVEREEGQYQESYGVGTSLYLELPGETTRRLILCAVTRKRAGEGIKAEPAYIFAGVQSICRIMNDARLTTVHVPLMGAGHGDMDCAAALFCLASALAMTPDIRRANIVIFRRSLDNEPALAPAVARKILAFVARTTGARS